MYPGKVSKIDEETIASAATIAPKKDLIRLTGTTGVDTISLPATGGFGCVIMIYTPDGAVTFSTTGNVAIATTTTTNRLTIFAYSKSQAKWIPGAIS